MPHKETKNLLTGDELNHLNLPNNLKPCYFMDILYLNDLSNQNHISSIKFCQSRN